ncbi:MAG: PilC/PilY family type IV pilus protein, partial [Nitrospirota bacterium]|nr:PilC/PilY family type IV pilus protein [Nitrospirota bacterium]
MVDFQVCDVNDEASNGYEYCYDIMWDDAEYGWDYDLDIRYRLYVDVNPTAAQPCNIIPKPSGCPNSLGTSFGNTPASGTVRIKTKALYAASGHTDFAGYLINGVSTEVWTGSSAQAEGEYYDIRCGGTAGGTDCDNFNINDSSGGTNTMNDAVVVRDFIVNGSTADQLKDPFWYAAKYGGFKDLNGNNIPDNGSTSSPGPCTTTPGSTCEWDNNLDGVPDTYFYAANPLKLESQLANAFASILNKVSSGTAASVLASSTTGQGATYQSYFFASTLDAEREVKWTGYSQSVFVDVFGNLREDTNGDGKLIYTDDRIIVPRLDPTSNSVVIDKYNSNSNGQATGAAITTGVSLTAVKGLWEAGNKLAQTPSSGRNLWTWVDLNGDKKVSGSSELIPFDSTASHLTAITPYLRSDAVAPYTATNVIEFIRGCDPYVSGSTCAGLSVLRDRRITVGGSLQVWKLGDTVNASPVIVGAPRDRFDVIYGDAGYQQFYQRWRDRRQVLYVGANDGMLHAFNAGYYQQEAPGVHHGCFTQNKTDNCATQTTVNLGNELWGFIPQELLPQLRWLADPGYTHVYYVDLKPKVVDARIFADDGPNGTHPGGWGTILIGGFRMGGSCKNCPAAGNGRDMHFPADFGKGVVEDRHFYSAYFVLDITDPDSNPKLLWSFSDPNLGLTTSLPGIANVKDSSGNQKWFALFGSGPTSYDAAVNQTAKLFIVDLANGPVASPVVTIDASGGGGAPPNSFIGDITTVDRFLNFTDDVAYAGQVISGAPWQGKLLRLTTGCITGSCQTDPNQWGVPSLHVPSE